MTDLSERLLNDIVTAVKELVRKEQSDRLRDIYLIGDIEKDTARATIERLRELANDGQRPITLYLNSAGGNVTDGLAIHDTIRHLISRGVEITIVVQGMAYSMGSVVLQAASPERRLAYPHSWIMIHEPAEMGRMAIDNRRRSTPRPAEADAEPDLSNTGRTIG